MLKRSAGVSNRLFTVDYTITCIASFLVYLTFFVPLSVIPLYIMALGGKESDIGWITSLMSCTILLGRLVAAKWCERIGPARVMRASAVVLLIGTAGYNFAGALWFLVLTRVFHGSGYGTCNVSCSSVVAYMAPPARRGLAMGTFLMFLTMSIGIGPPLGIALANNFGYSAVFIVISGLALLLVAITNFARGLDGYGPEEKMKGSFISRSALLPALVGITAYFTFGALTSYLPVYALQNGLGNPGLFYTAYAVASAVVRTYGAKLSDRFGRRATIIPAALCMSLAMFWLAVAADPWSILGVGVLYGLGTGVLLPVLMALSVDMSRPDERSAAVGTFFGSLDAGQITGAAISGLLVAHFPLQIVWAAAGAVALAGLSVYAVVGRRGTIVGEAG